VKGKVANNRIINNNNNKIPNHVPERRHRQRQPNGNTASNNIYEQYFFVFIKIKKKQWQ
jgi:hypothetical protein